MMTNNAFEVFDLLDRGDLSVASALSQIRGKASGERLELKARWGRISISCN